MSLLIDDPGVAPRYVACLRYFIVYRLCHILIHQESGATAAVRAGKFIQFTDTVATEYLSALNTFCPINRVLYYFTAYAALT